MGGAESEDYWVGHVIRSLWHRAMSDYNAVGTLLWAMESTYGRVWHDILAQLDDFCMVAGRGEVVVV